jgi:hypothetical protein
MTSESKKAANQQNAQCSTGPRSAAGKRRASRNALRHGLAVSVLKDFAMSAEVERLAHAIMRQAGALVRLDQARIIAEAELELSRVRATRIALVQAKERDLREADSEQLPAADLFDASAQFGL